MSIYAEAFTFLNSAEQKSLFVLRNSPNIRTSTIGKLDEFAVVNPGSTIVSFEKTTDDKIDIPKLSTKNKLKPKNDYLPKLEELCDLYE